MAVTPIITSLLDTDLYKITMQAAIHKHYPKVPCEFLLTNRTPSKKLNRKAYDWLCQQIKSLESLRFTNEDIAYLKTKIGYLGDDHFKWLRTVSLNPDKEIKIVPEISGDEYNLTITACGDWEVVTLYEIPILSLLSECYFRFIDKKWKIEGKEVAILENGEFIESLPKPDFELVHSQAFTKTEKLLEAGCTFSEFGTRRRRSFEVQRTVMQGIMKAAKNSDFKGKFLGTSNVFFAKEFDVNPIGTIGHEWMMGVGAIQSMITSTVDGEPNYEAYLTANRLAMEQYVELVGPSHAGLALTDTYGTENFLKQFTEPYIGYYVGVRQDSGDPKEYARELSAWYHNHGYSGDKRKLICFSDSLNVSKCIDLKKVCDSQECAINSIFGIGTNLTNDFDTEPMNIVMKLLTCGGGHAIKISDNAGKNMGDSNTVHEVKKRLGYVEHKWAGGDESHRWKK